MILDSCINPKLHSDFELLYKARVLTAIICVYFSILVAVDIWLIYSTNIKGSGLKAALIICVGMQFAYISALILLKYKGLFTTVANFTIAMTAIGIAGGVLISGGPLTAPAIPMNILPIAMAFVLINKRTGLIWTQIILLSHATLISLQVYDFTFIQMLPEDMLEIQHMVHWLVIYCAMTGLMLIYDTLNSRLKSELNTERSKFQHMASHDPLTNIANRLQFDENLAKSINRSERNNKSLALFFIDLDGFKPINDNLGHDAGDVVLKEISSRLLDNIREMDTVARLGGDEFGIILEDISSLADLEKIADKILKIINIPITGLQSTPSVSASLGIALHPQHSKNKTELIKCADLAMYQAKSRKNHWEFFQSDIDKDALFSC